MGLGRKRTDSKNSRKGRGRSRAVIFDRDGTLIRNRHYLSDPDRIELYPGIVPALRKLGDRGWKLLIGTNQSGIGRGFFSLKVLKKIHDRLEKMFREKGLRIDDIYFCPHAPWHKCRCRKPAAGMLLKARKKHRLDLKRCVVVGDNESDVRWGKKAGTKTVLVLTGYGKKTLKEGKIKPDHVSRTAADAADWIMKNNEPE